MLQAGTVVAQHLRLVRQLGSGGMGSVWVAEHLRLGGQVAVKFLSTALLDHASARSRFAREAKWAAKIRSPHVVQVHDHGVVPGDYPMPYIVMELLDGRDLSSVLVQEGPLGLARAAEILEQVCEALTTAHAAGVVHRDIKPENVFLLEQTKTFVKLLDFGVAHGDDGQIDRLTQTGLLLGTAHYMSPEQLFSGKDIDHRADLWALGVLTYQMLTNDLPFQADTFGQLCLRVKDGTFPPLNDFVNVPPGVEQWFERALCLDREARFQSASEAYEAFARVAAGLPMVPAEEKDASEAMPLPGTGTVRMPLGSLGAKQVPTAEESVINTESQGALSVNTLQGAGLPRPRREWWWGIGLAAALVTGALGWLLLRGGAVQPGIAQATGPLPMAEAAPVAEAAPTGEAIALQPAAPTGAASIAPASAPTEPADLALETTAAETSSAPRPKVSPKVSVKPPSQASEPLLEKPLPHASPAMPPTPKSKYRGF